MRYLVPTSGGVMREICLKFDSWEFCIGRIKEDRMLLGSIQRKRPVAKPHKFTKLMLRGKEQISCLYLAYDK